MIGICALLAATVLNVPYYDGDPRYYASPAKRLPVAEGVTCEVTYSPARLAFLFRGKGEPGGTIQVQVRPGARKCVSPVAPFACVAENRYGGRVRNLVAETAPTDMTPTGRISVEVKANKKGDGWDAFVTVPFRDRLERWPVCEGARRPPTWLAAFTLTDAAGNRTDWGTVAEPLQLSWGKSAGFKEARDGLFKDQGLMAGYAALKEKYADLCDHSQKERWIGYLDPGTETFAWRQADSEKLFYERCAEPVFRAFDGAMELLRFRPTEENPNIKLPPKALALAEPAKMRLYGMLEDFARLPARMEEIRRDYLLARFTGRTLAVPEPPKAKPKTSASKITAPDADADDTGDLSLDDKEMEF